MEILGLIDTLESVICDSIKIPFTGKTIVNESDILSIIDKMRLVLQSGEGFSRTKIATKAGEMMLHAKPHEGADGAKAAPADNPDGKAAEIIQQAYQVSKEIRAGADRYADDVLATLEATTGRIIRTVKNGRVRLNKTNPSDSQYQGASREPVPEIFTQIDALETKT
ncbi:MAG: hypothetical protein NTZ10_02765 [Candidatus Saganbacteria bacterium]|nr:hypothetical protein [Candidatus Saganbacteria bacterium]